MMKRGHKEDRAMTCRSCVYDSSTSLLDSYSVDTFMTCDRVSLFLDSR